MDQPDQNRSPAAVDVANNDADLRASRRANRSIMLALIVIGVAASLAHVYGLIGVAANAGLVLGAIVCYVACWFVERRLSAQHHVRRGGFPVEVPMAKRSNERGGFTLVELLVVMALIVLLIALAVPAFSFISGGKSVDGAQNVIAAMLGRARSEAINGKTTAGVVFFYDVNANRNAMVLVIMKAVGDYEFWAAGKLADGVTDVSYRQGDRVLWFAQRNNEYDPGSGTWSTVPNGEGKVLPRLVEAKVNINQSLAANAPPFYNQAENAFWTAIETGGVEVVEGSDIEYLPAGVAVNVVRDTRGTGPGTSPEKYTATGAILFDETGAVSTEGFTVTATSSAGRMMGLTPPLPFTSLVTTGGVPILYGSLGLMLCEREPLSNQPGYTPGDLVTAAYFPVPAPASYADEDDEESWLDQNGLLLVVNRSNGSLTRGE